MNTQAKKPLRPQVENLVARLRRQGFDIETIQQILREVADDHND